MVLLTDWASTWGTGQAETPLGDDVELDLVGAACDVESRHAEDEFGPGEGVLLTVVGEGTLPQNGLGEIGDLIGGTGHQHLEHGAGDRLELVGPGPGRETGGCPQCGDGSHAPGHLRRQDRVGLRTESTYQGVEPLQHVRRDRTGRAAHLAALGSEAGAGDSPPLPDRTDAVGVGDPDLVEEDLVEGGATRHLTDRPDGDSGRVHVHEEHGESSVLLGRRIGADERLTDVGEVGHRRPDLLAGDHPVVPVAHRLGSDPGEVGARAGFGEQLAAHGLGPVEPGELSASQLRAGVVEQCRTDDVEPDEEQFPGGEAHVVEDVVEDVVVCRRQLHPTELAGAAREGETGVVQRGLEPPGPGDLFLVAVTELLHRGDPVVDLGDVVRLGELRDKGLQALPQLLRERHERLVVGHARPARSRASFLALSMS